MILGDEPEIPGYSVEKRIGRGGMATVYLAVQETMKRHVALKVMSSQLGDDNVWAKRFIQEAQVIAQLSHPGIVPVYDVGAHDGQFYISMEYLEGHSLKGRMREGISIPEVIKIIVGVAAGLDFAGEKGFVHRDIKPDNIMFRSDGSPVILDFGIVKQMGDGPNKMTQTGVIVGTTSYMSPEQAQGRDLDQRSDIYALGVMFYELLTGKPPFKGETDVATLLMHINDPIPELSGDLAVFQAIIDGAMAKDVNDRYGRASDMIDHIGRIEPEIKAALAATKVGNASDLTVVKTLPDDDDATKVMGAGDTGTNTGSITTEEELTKVLSSAKATIRNNSVEVRESKARRTKHLFSGVSLLAVLALGYVGYQQIVVVPKERALNEEKLRDAELKSANKVKQLLAEAKQLRYGLIYSDFEKVDEVIARYRQILKLDPENKDADFILQKFGDRYVDMSKDAVRRRDLDRAETYRDYAEQLVPKSAMLPGLRNVIKALRAEALDQEFIQEEIDTLLAVAETDIANVKGFSDSAYTKLQQVLRLDPNSETAKIMIADMLERVVDQTDTYIDRGRYSRARTNITILEKYYQNTTAIAQLQTRLNEESAASAAQKNIQDLISSVDRLTRERRTISVNDALREKYISILQLDKQHVAAKRGLDDCSDFDAALATQAIDDRDFRRAQRQLDLISRVTPNYPDLSTLRARLSSARTTTAKADQLLVQADDIIANDARGEERRIALSEAESILARVEKIDPNNPKIKRTTEILESHYVDRIREAIADRDTALSEAYFKDSAGRSWPTDRILQLKLAQQKSVKKSKPKRIITGGF